MSERFQVRVEDIRFDAAHFATFGGNCEPLHGHSYSVAAEVDGWLTDDSWVVDFTRLKTALRALCKEIDHRMILQLDSRLLRIEEGQGCWQVQTPAGLAYTLPASDVAALPIDNSTAERLAQWLCGKLQEELAKRGGVNLDSVLVEVWEGPGQRASCKRGRLPVE